MLSCLFVEEYVQIKNNNLTYIIEGLVWCDSGYSAALSHSGSPGVVPEENGTFLDDAHNVSEWREVLTSEEVPFEFEARGKLRHR